MNELIYKQDAIDAMCLACGHDCDKSKFVYNAPQDEQVIMCPEHYALSTLPSASTELSNNSPKLDNENGELISRQDAIDAINAYLGLSAVSRTIQNMTNIQEILENLPSASAEFSTFSDKLWKIAYERGKAEGQTEAWEFAIDAYYGTTKEQELFECLTFTQAKTEREELGKCEEKNNAGQIFVELANHINRCINDAVKKMREGEEE